jgi:hypothetical protein
MKEIIMSKIGNYANGLIAFVVLQGLAYSFYFGSNKVFNCTVHISAYLAEVLSEAFFVVTILAAFAVKKSGSLEIELAPEYEPVIKKLTRGKVVVVLLFGFFPFFLTLFYGVFGP